VCRGLGCATCNINYGSCFKGACQCKAQWCVCLLPPGLLQLLQGPQMVLLPLGLLLLAS
jgi:hypothetical protein